MSEHLMSRRLRIAECVQRVAEEAKLIAPTARRASPRQQRILPPSFLATFTCRRPMLTRHPSTW
eukprot:scaffold20011_cov33-Tisochrysis_lutea.AAC.3